MARVHEHRVGQHGNRIRGPVDPTDRLGEPDALAELRGERERDRLRTVDESILLGAVTGAGEHVDPVPRVRVEERVQEREVRRLGGEHCLGVEREELTGAPRHCVAPDPRFERLAVPVGGAVGSPRRVEGHARRHPIEAQLCLRHVGEHRRVQSRNRAVVAPGAAAEAQEVLALVVGGERGEPEILGEVGHSVLSGADPLTTVVDRRPVGEALGQHPPADAIAGLEHDDVASRGHDVAGRDEPGETAADDADVALEGLVRHGSNGTSPRYGASMPLAASLERAESALLDERRPLTRAEVLDVAHLPLEQVTDLVALAHRVRLEYCGDEVELESLINAKSGACPEDCAFCSQSARFATEVDVYPFLDLDEVVGAARATRDAGATQFCIVVAVRGPEERLLSKVIDAVDAVHRETGLEVACSLGLLTRAQAERLAEAGVRRYNHNLETCRAVFPRICTTHTYDDRVETARARDRRRHGALLGRHPRDG